MTEPEKLSLQSMRITEDQKAKLKQIFPEVFNEDNIDFDKLRLTLGEEIDQDEERFGMTWSGRNECFKVIQEPSLATLKPCKEESIDWDNTENLFVEGDNLEVLKLLQRAYYGKIKMIYIDPPYNTGKEFVYPDKYSESIETYLAYTGQIDAEGMKFSTHTESEGRFHSKWLNMMYPRLFLARNLLSEDGFIVISIDDSEASNLNIILKEVFGEENDIAILVWDRNRKNDATFFSVGHEYMLIYAKNRQSLREKGIRLREPKEGINDAKLLFDKLVGKHRSDWERVQSEWREYFKNIPDSSPIKKLGRYAKVGPKGPYRDDGNISWPGGGGPRYEVIHPKTGKSCKTPDGGWRYSSPERFWEDVKKGRVVFGPDETTLPRQCRYLFDGDGQVMPSVFYSYAQTAAMEFVDLMGNRVFENPKNWKDIRRIIRYLCGDSDIVLDFFSGSGTTAHSVLDLNQEDGVNHKFIMVQLPEPCEESSEAYRSGYKTVAEIGKERIGKVIRKIKEEQSRGLEGKLPGIDNDRTADLGFRSFKLDKSNFNIWDGEVPEDGNMEKQLELAIDHITPDSSDEDILYELLLKSGFELTTKIKELNLAGKKVHSIADNALLICLERELTKEVITEMARLQPARVVCLDAGFAGNDQLKTNAVQIMKSHDVEDFRTV